MDTTAVVALLAGLVVGLLVGFAASRLVARAQDETGAAQAREDAARAHQQSADARAETERARADLERLRTTIAEVDAQVAESRLEAAQAQADASEISSRLASMEAQRDAALQRAADLAADRVTLLDRFKVLSAETLAQQSRTVEASAEQRLQATEQVLAPVKESLQAMNERLAEVERSRASFTAELREQVRSVTVTGENLRRETNVLSTALRKPQVRGAWGELQLKRVVEIAGMVEHCDFLQQTTTTTSGDATIRPDMKVMLGEGKFLYVDSKVPLAAFLDAQEARDEASRNERLASFARNVKAHVDQLSGKRYWTADVGTPEFVVLFIPSEALAAEALSQLPDLHEYAAGKNIILATPTTLIGLLRAVAYSWKQAALADSAAEVFVLGRELYDRLGTLGSNFDKLGRSLQSSLKNYNAAVASMEGRVMVTARRFRDLQVTDTELRSPGAIDEPLRQISAPELVEDAGQVETIIGREPRSSRDSAAG